MRYNILIVTNNKINYTTIHDAAEGVSQPLFDKGVRIHRHDLPRWEALEIAKFMDAVFYISYESFVKKVLGDIDPGEVEPKKAWMRTKGKFALSKWDNPLDQRKIY